MVEEEPEETNRNHTTIAVKNPAYKSIERIQNTYHVKTKNDVLVWLVWYHDLVTHFDYEPDEARKQATILVRKKSASPIEEI